MGKHQGLLLLQAHVQLYLLLLHLLSLHEGRGPGPLGLQLQRARSREASRGPGWIQKSLVLMSFLADPAEASGCSTNTFIDSHYDALP